MDVAAASWGTGAHATKNYYSPGRKGNWTQDTTNKNIYYKDAGHVGVNAALHITAGDAIFIKDDKRSKREVITWTSNGIEYKRTVYVNEYLIKFKGDVTLKLGWDDSDSLEYALNKIMIGKKTWLPGQTHILTEKDCRA
jgi:hypothetical protein